MRQVREGFYLTKKPEIGSSDFGTDYFQRLLADGRTFRYIRIFDVNAYEGDKTKITVSLTCRPERANKAGEMYYYAFWKDGRPYDKPKLRKAYVGKVDKDGVCNFGTDKLESIAKKFYDAFGNDNQS